MWPLFLEYALSTLWAFAYAVTVLLFIISPHAAPGKPDRHEPVPAGIHRAPAGVMCQVAVPRQFVYRATL